MSLAAVAVRNQRRKQISKSSNNSPSVAQKDPIQNQKSGPGAVKFAEPDRNRFYSDDLSVEPQKIAGALEAKGSRRPSEQEVKYNT